MTIHESVLQIVARETGQAVSEHTPLDTLGLDSLDLLDLLMSVSVALDKDFHQEDVTRIETVGDIVRQMEAR